MTSPMPTVTTPAALKRLYAQGVNISAHLRAERGLDHNTADIIELSYDLQAGSYVAAMADPAVAAGKAAYAAELARTILALCDPASVLEAGVGEATTLAGVLRRLPAGVQGHGFDLSWSRVAQARAWLVKQGVAAATLCTGNLFDIPYADDAIDVVYTSHSIEPNGGSEAPILRELLRVARRYVVLLEPGYELADEAARERMASHGYCRNLPGVARDLGMDVLRHERFAVSANPLNPTALTVIRKHGAGPVPDRVLACPQCKTPLDDVGGMLYSVEALRVYPVVGGIACLRIDNGIVASQYQDALAASPGR